MAFTKIKFEDWTPPFTDEEFDADKAKKLIFNLQNDKGALQDSNQTLTEERDAAKAKVTEFETKDLTEVERLKRENEELKKAPPKAADDLTAARLEIALEKGLTAAQAKRLQGGTREELEADATSYIEEHGLGGSGGENDGKPPSRKPTNNLKTGLENLGGDDDVVDPRKIQEERPRRRL